MPGNRDGHWERAASGPYGEGLEVACAAPPGLALVAAAGEAVGLDVGGGVGVGGGGVGVGARVGVAVGPAVAVVDGGGVSVAVGDAEADGDVVTGADAGGGLRVASTKAATTRPTTTTAPAMTSRRCHVHRDGGASTPASMGKPRSAEGRAPADGGGGGGGGGAASPGGCIDPSATGSPPRRTG